MRSCSSCRPPCPPPDSPPASCAFLMQKILGCGRLHLRQRHYTLCLSGLPCQAKPPFSLLAAAVCGTPGFEEAPCHERNALRLIVTLPLSLRLRDCDGNIFSAAATIEEAVTLRLQCPCAESWRGQIVVQGAVRAVHSCGCRGGCGCGEGSGCNACAPTLEATLETVIDAFLIAPAAMGAPCAPPCPEPRPWYPEPPCSPW